MIRYRGAIRWFLQGCLIASLLLTVMALPGMAAMQSNIQISDNGTVYWAQSNDISLGKVRVTTVGLGASTGALVTNANLAQNGTLTASSTVNPLFGIGSVRRTGIFACTLPGIFNASANSGNGSWNVGGAVINGFSDVPNLTDISNNLGGIPSAQTGVSQFGFNSATPTTTVGKGAPTPADGFTLNSGDCVVYVLNSSALLTPGTTLTGAGASAGFMDNFITGTVQFVTGKTDTVAKFLPTTTTTTTTLPPPTIPTTGEWGMMIFGASLLGFMAWMIQARRSIK